ncbi:MAG: hypothetical protein KAG28_08990 [Cocleimonas sp.]|nr:hypothetical protein [Cocleimonas sp.]
MNKQKSNLQKLAGIIGKLCFILSVVCAVTLYFKVNELGMQHPISASFLASSFFFIFVGIVLTVIDRTDIPSFKLSVATDKEKIKQN